MKKTSHSGSGNLFSDQGGQGTGADEPLAARMRPRTIDEFIGQDHIMGPGRLLRRAIQADMLTSVIFSGPPGTGKTTLARVIANTTRSHFLSLNAVLSGVKEVREAIARAQELRDLYGRKTILFVDEVHRWNKAQQDALLPWVENGTIILIGATTENPFFEVNSALVSRSRIFQLKPLTREEMRTVAAHAISDPVRGYGAFAVDVEDAALDHLIDVSDGDARTLLNALQLAIETTPAHFPPIEGERIRIDLAVAEDSIQKKVVLYDKEGDYHFDTISAFIKSLRGSDPDAALYWIARMVRAGEDPHFLFRRMLISACEDVGLADPNALVVVEAAAAAFDRVGLPEGQFHLTHAALYLATAPKSNSALGFFDALKSVQEEPAVDVPSHLKDASRDKEGFGHGEGYLYPHAYRDHWVAQAYLPPALKGRTFYHPSEVGYEGRIREDVERRRELQLASMLERMPEEILTFSPESREYRRWVNRISAVESDGKNVRREQEPAVAALRYLGQAARPLPSMTLADILSDIRTRLYAGIEIARHSTLYIFDPGAGTLIWEGVRRAREGFVYGVFPERRLYEVAEHLAAGLPEIERPQLHTGTILDPLEAEIVIDRVIARDPVTRGLPAASDGARSAGGTPSGRARVAQTFSQIAKILAPGGSCSVAQIVPRGGARLSDFLAFDAKDAELGGLLAAVEEKVYANRESPLVGWGEEDILAAAEDAGLVDCHVENEVYPERRLVRRADIERWIGGGGRPGSYGAMLEQELSGENRERFRELLLAHVADRHVAFRICICYMSGRKP